MARADPYLADEEVVQLDLVLAADGHGRPLLGRKPLVGRIPPLLACVPASMAVAAAKNRFCHYSCWMLDGDLEFG